ncbi:P-loop containing nucleoside triphosphate hydrolase protein [Lichtheimia hyalospora FSU 10163]|nr:P-loop containing nucleoside triphosphate hydrolase protein [Lichtheimia hyalospora FSU 10163]
MVQRPGMQQPLTSFFSPTRQQQQQRSSNNRSRTSSSSISTSSILLGSNDFDVPPTPPAPPSPNTPCAHVFDADELPTWIYPINYPLRLYQFNIVKKALFHNTLVALPTGLGKTFIAAVVMFNYWRWFPQSKVIFMAPTKPLVAQQIEACFNVCGIPQSELIEITGHINRAKRKELWRTHRVFFMTPQTLKNDLESRICPAHQISCIVVDEAHKASGGYAYGEVVKLISREQDQYRILALTATPGTNLGAVQTVVSQLHITNIQIRTEDSMDIQEYSYGKRIQHITVRLSYMEGATGIVPEIMNQFRDKFFQPVLNRLNRFQAVFTTDPDRNTTYGLLQAQKGYSANARNVNYAVKSMVATDFSIAQALSRAYDYLMHHGIAPFVEQLESFLKDLQDTVDAGKNLPKEKYKLFRDYQLKNMIEDLKQRQSQPGFMGHPKMERLLSTVLDHLSNNNERDTRIIVFSSFRSSVNAIIQVLEQHKPLVKCSLFVGQAGGKDGKKGLNQREQKEIVERFKRGEINVLVATAIGEEGLDIGEVDLIICYDSQSSPIRMLQRMGRTGRKRQGRCVMIMTEQEERKYNQAKAAYAQVQRAIARGGDFQYYTPNPSVLPEKYRPVWCQKRLDIGTFFKPTGRKSKKTKAVESNGTLTDATRHEFLQSLNSATLEEAFEKHWPTKGRRAMERVNRYLPNNAELTSHHRIGHSRRTIQFVSMIKNMERRLLREMTDIDESSQPNSQPRFNNDELIMPTRPSRTTDELILPTPIRARQPDPKQSTLSTFLNKGKAPANNHHRQSPPAKPARDNWMDDNDPAMTKDIAYQPVQNNDIQTGKRKTITTPAVSEKRQRIASPPSNQLDQDEDIEIDFDLGSDDDVPQPTAHVPVTTTAATSDTDYDQFAAELDFDYCTQDIQNNKQQDESFERILPPELSKSTPLMDESPVRTAISHTPTMKDDVNIAPAMLKWLTTRPPPFSETAALLVHERMNIVKIKAWIGNETIAPPTKTRSSTPSFGDDDDFEIDFEMLEALENKIPIQDTPFDASFHQMLENKVGEDYEGAPSSFHIPADEDDLPLSNTGLQNPIHHDPVKSSTSPSPKNKILSQALPSSPMTTKQPLSLQSPSSPQQQQQPVVESPRQHEKILSSPDRSMQTTPIHDDLSDKTLSPSPLRRAMLNYQGSHNMRVQFIPPSPVSRPRQPPPSPSAIIDIRSPDNNKAPSSPLRKSITVNEAISIVSSPSRAQVVISPDQSRFSSPSPVFARRRRNPKMRIGSDEEEEQVDHDERSKVIPDTVISDTDDGQRLQLQQRRKRDRHQQRHYNPFLDLEAELSSDEDNMPKGRRRRQRRAISEDENDDGGSSTTDLSRMDSSFIDDEEGEAASSADVQNMYRISLMSQPPRDGESTVFTARRKTWIDKFEAEKWLQDDEDDIVNMSRLTEEAENENLALEVMSSNDDDFM